MSAPEPVPIHLDGGELYLAALAGIGRQIRALKNGWKDRGGPVRDGWRIHIEGAAGEIAAAKALGLYWGAGIFTNFQGGGDFQGLEVKTRSRHDRDLVIWADTQADQCVILVTGCAPDFVVRGFVLAGDVKRDEWRNDLGRGPVYCVPQTALRSLDELRAGEFLALFGPAAAKRLSTEIERRIRADLEGSEGKPII